MGRLQSMPGLPTQPWCHGVVETPRGIDLYLFLEPHNDCRLECLWQLSQLLCITLGVLEECCNLTETPQMIGSLPDRLAQVEPIDLAYT